MNSDSPGPQIAQRVRILSWMVGIQWFLLILIGWMVSALLWGESVQVEGLQAGTDPVQSTEYGDYEDEMRAYFELMKKTLEGKVRSADAHVSEYVPTDDEIDAAVETRTMHSDESRRVDQKLRRGFDKFDLDWTIAKPEK